MNKYGIYTIVAGDYAKSYADLCLPSQKAYAEYVNADFYVLTENDMKPEYPTAHFLVWAAMEKFLQSEHERFLFLDADIIVQRGTPDIFAEHAPGKMYMRFGHSFEKIEKWVKDSRERNEWPTEDTFDPTGAMDKYYSSGVILADRDQIETFLSVSKPPFVIGYCKGEMYHYNYFLAKGNIPVTEMHPRWHFTRAWADGVNGKSLADGGVDKLEDIYLMHYAVQGDKVIAIKNDRHIYGYLGFDNTDIGSSNINVGVIMLAQRHISNPIMNNRLDIEDNIGEGIHIHYKNLRLDFTIEDFIELAKAFDQSLQKYIQMRNQQ